MAEEKKNAAEVQEDTEKEISENETVTEAQEDSPEATAGENTAEGSEASADEKTEGKTKTSFFGKKKKDKKDQQIEELTDRLKRSMAEFDNFRKRTEKEKSSMYVIGANNFERGLAQAQEGDAFADGMKMIYKQLMTTLEGLGVEAIEAVGKEFDPDFHNAVMHVEDEKAGDNMVVEELQKGYTYKGFVVRHSMVKVAN